MKLLSTGLIMALLTFGVMGTSTAQACAKCGCSEAKTMKPCEKHVKAAKTCNCGHKAQKPCEKSLGKRKTMGSIKTEKGDFQILSRGSQNSPYND